ncbi:MAG: hypothetical protein ACRD11_07710 [Terriglobia bacterium]
MPNPQAQARLRMVASKLSLPFTAVWGSQLLPPGDYDVFLLASEPAPVVVIHGVGVSAMLVPSVVVLREKARLNSVFFTAGDAPPRVHLMRLARVGMDLQFQEVASHDPRPIRLPLHETD